MSKIRQGFQWTAGFRGIEFGVGIGRTLLLMMLLGPHEYGLIALAFVFVNILENLTASGIGEAVIQAKGDPRRFYDGAFAVRILRQNAIGILTIAASPLCAAFFKAPELARLMQAVGAAYMVSGFENVASFHFKKTLELKKLALFNHAVYWCETLATVLLVWMMDSPVGFGFGVLAARAFRVGLSYAVGSYLARPRLDWADLSELFRFGKWVTGYTLVGFLGENLETFVLGKLLGLHDFGVLNSARNLSTRPSRALSVMGREVLFPYYSRLPDAAAVVIRHFRLARAYLYFIPPLCYLACVLAEPVVRRFLSPEWIRVIPALQIYAWVFFFHGFVNAVAFVYFNAIGRPKLNFSVGVWNMALGTPMILLAAWFRGLEGMLAVELIRNGMIFTIAAWHLHATSFFARSDIPTLLKGPILLGLIAVVASAGTGFLPGVWLPIFGASAYLAFFFRDLRAIAVWAFQASKFAEPGVLTQGLEPNALTLRKQGK